MQGTEIRLTLEPSGLLGEVSTLPGATRNTYYGFNVTKTNREPIDQIHGFLAARRLQERGHGKFVAFVAGLFEVVNCTTEEQREELIIRNRILEENKRLLFDRLADRLGVSCHIVTTEDMWKDVHYWALFLDLISDRSKFSRRAMLQDTLRWYESPQAAEATVLFRRAVAGYPVPDAVLEAVGSWPAALLYTPLEVAEAKYFHEVFDVNVKIGHMEEKTYDRYIAPFMSIVHLRQPTCLKSSRLRPRTVTPYIDKDRRDPKIRISFTDSEQDIRRNLTDYVVHDGHVLTISPVAGELLHPVLDKAVFVVEAARTSDPITIERREFTNGADLIRAVSLGELSIKYLQSLLPQLVCKHIIG